MKPLTKHLIPGLAALAGLGAAASLAAAAPPDLQPFIDAPDSANPLGPAQWYVETSVDGGTYAAHYFHSAQLLNNGGGALKIAPGSAAGGTIQNPVVQAKQDVDGTVGASIPGVQLVGDQQGPGGNFVFGVQGLVDYTLTPAGGAAIPSQLGPVCWIDNTEPSPGAPATFVTAGCTTAAGSAAGFVSGISAGWRDAVVQGAANGYFNITGVAPGSRHRHRDHRSRHQRLRARQQLEQPDHRHPRRHRHEPHGLHDRRHRRRRGPDRERREPLGARPAGHRRRARRGDRRADVHDRLGPVQRHARRSPAPA